MNKLLGLALALTLATAGTAALAGIAPTHDSSQLSQSGAKIAAPKKQEEDQNKRSEPEQARAKSADCCLAARPHASSPSPQE